MSEEDEAAPFFEPRVRIGSNVYIDQEDCNGKRDMIVMSRPQALALCETLLAGLTIANAKRPS